MEKRIGIPFPHVRAGVMVRQANDVPRDTWEIHNVLDSADYEVRISESYPPFLSLQSIQWLLSKGEDE